MSRIFNFIVDFIVQESKRFSGSVTVVNAAFHAMLGISCYKLLYVEQDTQVSVIHRIGIGILMLSCLTSFYFLFLTPPSISLTLSQIMWQVAKSSANLALGILLDINVLNQLKYGPKKTSGDDSRLLASGGIRI